MHHSTNGYPPIGFIHIVRLPVYFSIMSRRLNLRCSVEHGTESTTMFSNKTLREYYIIIIMVEQISKLNHHPNEADLTSLLQSKSESVIHEGVV